MPTRTAHSLHPVPMHMQCETRWSPIRTLPGNSAEIDDSTDLTDNKQKTVIDSNYHCQAHNKHVTLNEGIRWTAWSSFPFWQRLLSHSTTVDRQRQMSFAISGGLPFCREPPQQHIWRRVHDDDKREDQGTGKKMRHPAVPADVRKRFETWWKN